MTHLELENLVSEYLEGQLDAARQLEFEAHLGSCPGCRGLLADVRQAMEFCRLAEDPEPTPWLIPKILLATIGERQPTLIERLAAVHPGGPESAHLGPPRRSHWTSVLRARREVLLRPPGGLRD